MTSRSPQAPQRSLFARNPYPRQRVSGVQFYEHTIVYERVFGPVPADHVIHHEDGDFANNSPLNLSAVTKAQHLALHSESAA